MKILALVVALSVLLGLGLVAPTQAQQREGMANVTSHWWPGASWRPFGPSWGSHFPPSPIWQPNPWYPNPYRYDYSPLSYRRYMPGRYIQVWIPPEYVQIWTGYGWDQVLVQEGYYKPIWIPGHWE